MSKINIAEIFGPTIQGEGPNVGMKCIFVRVVGCDFNCEWCDSKFAWKQDENTLSLEPNELSEKLIKLCKDTNTDSVVLTGGNPCLYDFESVIRDLHEEGISVDVETQGSKLPDWLYSVDQLVISPKAPSSKQSDVYDNIRKFLNDEESVSIGYNVAIKIPIFNEEDFQFALRYYKMVEAFLYEGMINIKFYLSVGNTDTHQEGSIADRVLKDYETLIEKVCNSEMKNVYILPQVHTLVWGNKQGV